MSLKGGRDSVGATRWVRSAYKGVLFIVILSLLLLCTVLLLAFIADPQGMWDSVRQAFQMAE